MKKLAILAATALAVATFTACNNGNGKAEIKDGVDSLSYAAGLQSAPMMDQAMQQMQIDSTYQDEVIKGIYAGIKSATDKKKAAYNAGIIIGNQLAMMNKAASQELFSGDSTQTLSLKNLVAGFVAGATKKNMKMTEDQAREYVQTKSQQLKSQSAEKMYGPAKKAAEKWMADNAKKAGVKTLGQGVQYKVLKEGTGAIPTNGQNVKLNYELKGTDGKVIESTFGKQPTQMPVSGVIPGFTEALTHMPVGSKWEVYIPYSAGYGERQAGPIKPFSNLIFTIELLSVEAGQGVPTPAQPAK